MFIHTQAKLIEGIRIVVIICPIIMFLKLKSFIYSVKSYVQQLIYFWKFTLYCLHQHFNKMPV